MRNFITILSCMLSFFIVNHSVLFAQTAIRGKVTEADGKTPLPRATVFVKTLNKGLETDDSGDYSLTLPSGTFDISFSFIGFECIEKKINAVGAPIRLDISMQKSENVLQEVIITSKSNARQIREQAMPISVITMKELQGTVSDVSQVLSKTSGVKIRTSGGVGSSSRISVRGLEGKRIGFFIDEIPLSDNTDFLDINDVPMDMIDRVEVYKGIVPAKLGGSAIGGAVNIVMKEYPPRYVDASYTLSSFNTHKMSTAFKHNRNGIEMGVGGFYTYSDNNYTMELPLHPGKHVKRDHDQFKKLSISGGLKSTVWWFDEVVIEPVLVLTEQEIQGIEHNIQEAKNYSDAYALAMHTEKTNFMLEGLDFDMNNSYTYTLSRFQDKAMNRYAWDGSLLPPVTTLGGEVGKQPNDARNRKHTFMHKTNLDYILHSCHSLNLNMQYNYAKGMPQDSLKEKVIGYKTDYNSRMNSFIAGISHEYNSSDNKLSNIVTLKYYFYSMQTRLVDLYGMTRTARDIDMKKNDYGASNAFRYRFTPDLLVKTSLAYNVRLPAENELLGDGFIIAPAGNLEPERNTSFNLGFMYDVLDSKQNRFQCEINGFYMQLENMIRLTGGPLQSMYQNFGKMRALGVEAEVKWDATRFIYLWGNITFQDLRDTRQYEPGTAVPNPTKGIRMPNIPYLFANAGIEFHKENLFGGKGQNTRVFSDSSFIEEYFYDFEQSIYQKRKIPRSITFNAGIEHSFNHQSIFVSVQANNLTDAKVLSEFNRPQPGRNFGAKIRYVWK